MTTDRTISRRGFMALAKIARDRGVTARELAAHLDCSIPSAQRLLDGKNAPHPAMRKYMVGWLLERIALMGCAP